MKVQWEGSCCFVAVLRRQLSQAIEITLDRRVLDVHAERRLGAPPQPPNLSCLALSGGPGLQIFLPDIVLAPGVIGGSGARSKPQGPV